MKTSEIASIFVGFIFCILLGTAFIALAVRADKIEQGYRVEVIENATYSTVL